jgi:uncharacterized protein YdhG (YjbR/CyaY superfamily)
MTAPKKTAPKKTAAEKAAPKKTGAEMATAKKPAKKAPTNAAKKPATKTAPNSATDPAAKPATKTATKTAKKAAKKAAQKASSASRFTDAERAAMKERAAELRATRRGGDRKAEDADAVLAKIAEMDQQDRALAERIHAIVTRVAPQLAPKTWYGMPAYAKEGKVVCFFQPAARFGVRYASFGFNDSANLDDGTMWPTSYAVTDLTDADAKRIEELVTRAVG